MAKRAASGLPACTLVVISKNLSFTSGRNLPHRGVPHLQLPSRTVFALRLARRDISGKRLPVACRTETDRRLPPKAGKRRLASPAPACPRTGVPEALPRLGTAKRKPIKKRKTKKFDEQRIRAQWRAPHKTWKYARIRHGAHSLAAQRLRVIRKKAHSNNCLGITIFFQRILDCRKHCATQRRSQAKGSRERFHSPRDKRPPMCIIAFASAAARRRRRSSPPGISKPRFSQRRER